MRTIDNIVIGSTATAAKFAEDNNFPILLTTPHNYALIDKDKREQKIKILFYFYIKGQALNHIPIERIEIEDNIMSFFDGYKRKEILFEKLFLFDFVNVNCEGFQVLEEQNFYRIIDWVNFRSGGEHNYDHIYIGDRTLFDIHFVPSKRHSSYGFKDAIVFSYLLEEELDCPDHSHSIMRLRLLQVFEEHELKNPRSGKVIVPKIEMADRQKNKIMQYKVTTPDNIEYYNSYYDEVIDGKTKSILNESVISLGWDSTDSQTSI
jgi:hypothetical protein